MVLGCGYTSAIDVWSLGCVAAELFLGLPLFPGASEHDLLGRITAAFGLPPAWLLDAAKHTDKFFVRRLAPVRGWLGWGWGGMGWGGWVVGLVGRGWGWGWVVGGGGGEDGL